MLTHPEGELQAVHMLDFSTIWRSTAPLSDVQLPLRVVKAFQHPRWDSRSQPLLWACMQVLSTSGLPLSKNYSEWKASSISRELWSQDQKEPWAAKWHFLIWNNTWLCWIALNSSGMKQPSPNASLSHSYDGTLGPCCYAYTLPNPLVLHLVTSSVGKGMLWGNWAILRDQFICLSMTSLYRARDSSPIWAQRGSQNVLRQPSQ